MTLPATPDDVTTYLDRTDTVLIATPRQTGNEVTTPIWAVTVDGIAYIRSGLGPAARWYRRGLRAGRAAFVGSDDAVRYDVALERVAPDPALERAVDRAYRRKYWHTPGPTRAMTASPSRDTTLRVTPLGSAHLRSNATTGDTPTR